MQRPACDGRKAAKTVKNDPKVGKNTWGLLLVTMMLALGLILKFIASSKIFSLMIILLVVGHLIVD